MQNVIAQLTSGCWSILRWQCSRFTGVIRVEDLGKHEYWKVQVFASW